MQLAFVIISVILIYESNKRVKIDNMKPAEQPLTTEISPAETSTDDGGGPEYIVINVGCSGGCTTGTASQVKVDYVRAWQ